jgi:hypothetical protein
MKLNEAFNSHAREEGVETFIRQMLQLRCVICIKIVEPHDCDAENVTQLSIILWKDIIIFEQQFSGII